MPDPTHNGPPSSSGLYLSDQTATGSSPDELHDSVIAREAPREEDLSFPIAMDDAAGAFVATAGGVEFGAVPFVEKDGRVVLLATSILPEYRGRGLAMALVRRVLEALLDPTDPGMVRRSHV